MRQGGNIVARKSRANLSVDQILDAIKRLPESDCIDLVKQLGSPIEKQLLAELTDGQFYVLTREQLLFWQRQREQGYLIRNLFMTLASLFSHQLRAKGNNKIDEDTIKLMREVHERRNRGETWSKIFDALKTKYTLGSLDSLKRSYKRIKNERPGYIEPINLDAFCADIKRLEQEATHRPEAALELEMKLVLHYVEVLRTR
jgi:hypothetical protein